MILTEIRYSKNNGLEYEPIGQITKEISEKDYNQYILTASIFMKLNNGNKVSVIKEGSFVRKITYISRNGQFMNERMFNHL